MGIKKSLSGLVLWGKGTPAWQPERWESYLQSQWSWVQGKYPQVTVFYFIIIKIILLQFPCQWYCLLICIVLRVSLLKQRNVWVCKWRFVRNRNKAIYQGQTINLMFPPPHLWRTFLPAEHTLGGGAEVSFLIPDAPGTDIRTHLCVRKGTLCLTCHQTKIKTAAQYWLLGPQSNLQKAIWHRGESPTLKSGT